MKVLASIYILNQIAIYENTTRILCFFAENN